MKKVPKRWEVPNYQKTILVRVAVKTQLMNRCKEKDIRCNCWERLQWRLRSAICRLSLSDNNNFHNKFCRYKIIIVWNHDEELCYLFTKPLQEHSLVRWYWHVLLLRDHNSRRLQFKSKAIVVCGLGAQTDDMYSCEWLVLVMMKEPQGVKNLTKQHWKYTLNFSLFAVLCFENRNY